MATHLVAPRQIHTQQEHYLRAAVAYNSLEVGTAGKFPLGTLPAGAIITGILATVSVAFNAATTNVLTVGTAASDASIVGADDLNEGAIGSTLSFASVGTKVSVDTPLFIKYAQTGTAASAGAADIILFFVPDNDR